MKRLIEMVPVVAAVVAVAAAPACAQATSVTVGANFSAPEEFAGNCGATGGCGAILLGANSPATGTASPLDGIVSSWRIEGSTPQSGYSINVVREEADGTFTVTAAGPTVAPEGNNLEAFKTDLPIKTGEYVEANFPEHGGIAILEGTATEAFFEPLLEGGETRMPSEEEEVPFVVGYNATIETEPTASPLPISMPAPVVTPPVCTVPKLKGKKLKAARKALVKADCKAGRLTGKKGLKSAKVVKQRPKPGTTLPAGAKVSLKLD